jgi:hypothetical protein
MTFGTALVSISVIYLPVLSYRGVIYCVHGDYMGWDELGRHVWLILKK